MNLDTLSEQYGDVAGKTLGFVIKSLAHPERKYTVEAKLTNGQYAIVRLGTGSSYLVSGTEDRYDFAVSMARIREVKTEIGELESQAASIAARLFVLNGELGTDTCLVS
jgi:hypothetical protein